MPKNEMFRVALFGGFNKDDVLEYIKSLENEIDSIKVLHQKEKNNLIRSMENQKGKEQEDEDEVLRLKSELDQKESALAGAQERSQQLESELDQKESALAGAQERSQQLESELNQKESALAGAQERSQQLETELSQRDVELNSVQEKLRQREEELDAIYVSQEFENREDEVENIRKELKQREDEVENIRKELEQKEEELSSVIKVLQDRTEELKNLQETVEKASDAESNQDELEVEAISKVLEDAKKNAEMIEADARRNAESILEKAKADIKEYEKQADEKMNAELVNKGIQLFAAKHKITHYMREVKRIQENLYRVYSNMSDMVETMPVRLDDYWAGANFKLPENDTKTQEPEDREPENKEENPETEASENEME